MRRSLTNDRFSVLIAGPVAGGGRFFVCAIGLGSPVYSASGIELRPSGLLPHSTATPPFPIASRNFGEIWAIAGVSDRRRDEWP
jgi:hypothetical protein